MAKTTVPTYLSAHQSIIDSGDATAITIDSSENISIGGQTNHDGAAVLIAHGDSGVTTYSDNADELVIENNGNAGISILTPNNATGSIIFGDSDDDDIGKIVYNHADNSLTLTATTTATSGNTTVGGTLGVTGAVTANAGVVVDNITIDGTEIDLSSGDLTLDVAGNINIDADGGSIGLNDAGTHVASLEMASSSNLYIETKVSDGDILLRGNDGGSTVTALTLDMSEAGTATFNHDVVVSGNLNFGNPLTLQASGNDAVVTNTTGNMYLQTDSTLRITDVGNNETHAIFNDNGAVTLYHDNSAKLATLAGGVDITGYLASDALASPDGTQVLYVANTGRVGVGQSSPDTKLHIGDGASTYVRIENASSGDVSSGYQIYRGASTLGASLYDNPADDATSLLVAGKFNLNAGGSGTDFHVTSDGKVGINTTSPYATLRVKLAAARSTAYDPDNALTWADVMVMNPSGADTSATGIWFYNNGTYHANAASGIALVKHTASSDYGSDMAFILRPQSAVAEERMRITSAGLVGIADNAPAYMLDINASSTASAFRIASGGSGKDVNCTITNGGTSATDDTLFDLTTAAGAGDPKIRWSISGTENYEMGIDNSDGDKLKISQGSALGTTDRITISGANVGIGDSSPGAKLDVNTGTTNTLAHFHSTDDNAFIELKDDDTTAYIGVQDDYLYIGGAASLNTQNLVINDGNGRVGIGTTSPNRPFEVYASGSDAAVMRITNGGNHVSGIELLSGHGNWAIHNSDTVGDALEFRDDSEGVTRMIIRSDGKVCVGTTAAPYTSAQFHAFTTTADEWAASFRHDGNATTSVGIAIICGPNDGSGTTDLISFKDGDGSGVGSITFSGGTTAYNTSSDERLKDITGDAKGLEVINQLKPVEFTWKKGGQKGIGLIAQEAIDHVPTAVQEDPETGYYRMDYSKLVTPLIKAVQEQQEQIEELKQEIKALKNGTN